MPERQLDSAASGPAGGADVPASTGSAFEFVGGWLCLDFVNTASRRVAGQLREQLHGYADLVAWAGQARLLSAEEAARLLAAAGRQPAEAAAIRERAVALRETVYRLFTAQSAGQTPSAADLATLNAELAHALAQARLIPTPDGFGWGWTDGEALDRPLWPVARSAAELLTTEQAHLVRACGQPTCTWLFLDTTKNHRRRWCDMQSCGNRAKARRHYQRRKSEAG